MLEEAGENCLQYDRPANSGESQTLSSRDNNGSENQAAPSPISGHD